MTGTSFNSVLQDLYFPTDHLAYPGKFKGMKTILEECRLHQFANLHTKCPSFKCADVCENCCCWQVLFNQPDFSLVKSLLEETCSGYSIEVLFLPKFHCELNPIEMCWGCAKWLYHLKPESSKEADLERNTLESLEEVPLVFMRRYAIYFVYHKPTLILHRYANRAHQFGDGYLCGLTGALAVWAAKTFHGHRVYPENIMAEFDRLCPC